MKSGKLSRLIATPDRPIFLRGEIWVAPEILSANGFSQSPKGLSEMASSVGADICFFPWHHSLLPSDLKDLGLLAHHSSLDFALTVDGPFQCLSRKGNLLSILEEIRRRPLNLQEQLAKETEKIVEELRWMKEFGVQLVILCDDIAHKGGLYFSPQDFRKWLLPFYQILVSEISSDKLALGWHSDGDVTSVLSDLVNCGYRFFSLEPECVDLLGFKRSYGHRVTLIGGIRTVWLIQKQLDRGMQQECLHEIKNLTEEGGFILASCCGLFNLESLPILKEIYSLTESIINLP